MCMCYSHEAPQDPFCSNALTKGDNFICIGNLKNFSRIKHYFHIHDVMDMDKMDILKTYKILLNSRFKKDHEYYFSILNGLLSLICIYLNTYM